MVASKKCKTCLILLLPFFSLPASATDWELKHDLSYRDDPLRNTVEYEDDGSFDKRKQRQKNRITSDLQVIHSYETTIDELGWFWKLGQKTEKTDDINRHYKQDGSLKKDKTRQEKLRIQYFGLGFKYNFNTLLGSDRWALSVGHNYYIDVDYSATDLHPDAKDYSGSDRGFNSVITLKGEYSTPSLSWYQIQVLEYEREYFIQWYDEIGQEGQESEQEEQWEAGIFANWIMPVNGWELIIGPLWQRENEAERKYGESIWQWSDQEQLIAQLKLEYEAPIPGFEMELKLEKHLTGEDKGQKKINLELSYEF